MLIYPGIQKRRTMAHTRNNTEFKILPFGRQERYLPRYWWLSYKVSRSTVYSTLISKHCLDEIVKPDNKV
jgi:hypothetical protein